MTMQSSGSSDRRDGGDEDEYAAFLEALRARFDATTAGGVDLFTTDATGLFDAFLDALPADHRQHYSCATCRRFVDRHGALVAVSADGALVPVLWDPAAAPSLFAEAVRAVARLVARSSVNGVFLSDETAWGPSVTTTKKAPRSWRHMAVVPAPSLVFRPPLTRTTSQVVAEKLEDYRMLGRGLAEFPVGVVRQAHALLTTGSLYRSEKCIGGASWLLALHEARAAKRGPAADNLTWLAVAKAPAGFCHVRSSMIGTLLEDVAAGMPFDAIKQRFDAKMHPLQYQRPTAMPSDGNIAQAEAIVATLASAGALSRRFARLDDVQALWRPAPTAREAEKAAGVFGHLKGRQPSAAATIEQPTITMTWEKFARTVLPGAEHIEFLVPGGAASFAALVTAAEPEAPPILQWDREEKRNPVSWYFYPGGTAAARWGLSAGAFHAVTAITLQPSMWGGDGGFAHHGEKVFFLLQGARDLQYARGAGYFPEFLRGEYHGVRRTMEAHAQRSVVDGRDEASACGIGLQKGAQAWNHAFRVTSKGTRITYRLDRWD